MAPPHDVEVRAAAAALHAQLVADGARRHGRHRQEHGRHALAEVHVHLEDLRARQHQLGRLAARRPAFGAQHRHLCDKKKRGKDAPTVKRDRS